MADDSPNLRRLPRSLHSWEVSWLPPPDEETSGLLVIVEQRTASPRLAAPIHASIGLTPLLVEACTSPPSPATPSRPPRLICSEPQLWKALQGPLAVLGLKGTLGATPLADDLRVRFVQEMRVFLKELEDVMATAPNQHQMPNEAFAGSDLAGNLLNFEHSIHGATIRPEFAGSEEEHLFVMCARREHATRAAPALQEVDAIRLEEGPDGVNLVAVRDGQPDIVISSVAMPPGPLRELRRQGHAVLVLVGDGPGVPFRDRDRAVVWRPVRVLGGSFKVDSVFRRPPARWPSADAALHRLFSLGTGQSVDSVPPEHLRPTMALVKIAWNAQTLADHHGDPSELDKIHRRIATQNTPIDQLLERCLQVKRACFRGDPRQMDIA